MCAKKKKKMRIMNMDKFAKILTDETQKVGALVVLSMIWGSYQRYKYRNEILEAIRKKEF